MNWILCGFKGCGKTYFANKLGLPFVDIDHLIEKKEGLSIQKLVQKKGLDTFRKIEEEIVTSIDVRGQIISIGGGSLFNSRSLFHLKALGKLILLNAPKSLIQKRMLSPPLPLYLDPRDPQGSFEKMWSTRITEYERICDFKIDLEGKSDAQILEELWRVINLEKSFASQPGASLMAKQSEL